jgi:hypothetical protein
MWRSSIQATRSAIVALMDPEGRRAWALVFMWAGGVAMTAFAGVALFLVRDHANYAFYLGLTALFIVIVIMTGFAGLLIKRTIKGSLLGNNFEISDEQTQAIADRVASAIPTPPPAPPATVVVQAGGQ